jgi:transposase
MRRHELSDTEWARLAPLLPPRTAGKPREDDRLVVNGIRWKLATGAPWRDLPERCGPWQSVYTRFRRWTRAGVRDRIFAAVQRPADAAGHLDGTVHFVDGAVIRAHQHAAGAKGGP